MGEEEEQEVGVGGGGAARGVPAEGLLTKTFRGANSASSSSRSELAKALRLAVPEEGGERGGRWAALPEATRI